MRRSVLVTLAAVSATFALGGLAAPASADPTSCAGGESNDLYTDICLPDIAPNSGNEAGPQSIPGNPDVGTVNGIPCTGDNTGTCIGLSRNQERQADVEADSTIRSSP
jgi:hypothetical protein